jgi:hypothetical protein
VHSLVLGSWLNGVLAECLKVGQENAFQYGGAIARDDNAQIIICGEGVSCYTTGFSPFDCLIPSSCLATFEMYRM